MRKGIFSLMLGTLTVLASCSKSDNTSGIPQLGEQNSTFSIEVPETRATVTGLSRYIVEAYEGGNITKEPIREESATGSLTLTLKKNTEYTFVFWADHGVIGAADNYYDVAKLQDVKVTPAAYNQLATPAYCSLVTFSSEDFEANRTIVLKHATAQINFVEADGIVNAGNTLKVTYSSSCRLNVATGKVTEIGSAVSRTYTNIAKIDKDGILVTDYILAPQNEKRLLDLKITFNSELEKTITGIPLQQNCKTNIKGEFSNFYLSSFKISNEVGNYVDNPDVDLIPDKKYKIGDYYPDDKNPIGVVFYQENGGLSGRVVALKEGVGLMWSTENVLIEAANQTRGGLVNVAAIKAHAGSNFATNYPAAAWCDAMNTPGSKYVWHLPGSYDLADLYKAWNGSYNKAPDEVARNNFNKILTMASGDAINSSSYLSSTNFSADMVYRTLFTEADKGGVTGVVKKNTKLNVRAMLVF